MKPRPACLPCILTQTFRVARESSGDDWSQRKVLTDVMRGLNETDWSRTPADILGDAIARTRETLKVSDPFVEHRARIQAALQPLAETFRARLAASPDPFALAVTAAAAANVVDELALRQVDCAAELEASMTAGFAIGGVEQLRQAVAAADSILYLLDNAGEVFFDAVLIGELRKMGKRVRAVASGGGLLHDARAEDAAEAKLGRIETVEVEVPHGEEAPPTPDPSADTLPDLIETPYGILGTPLPPSTKALKEAIADADLVIAKGSANYETFSAKAARVATVVYLLRAKCEPVAQSIGVPVGSLVLIKTSGQPKTGVIRRVEKPTT